MDIVIERTNKGNCPICDKTLDETMVFEDYNGSKQPVHKRHIKNAGVKDNEG
jgi:hypothetical protein